VRIEAPRQALFISADCRHLRDDAANASVSGAELGNDDGPRIIEETRQYIRDLDRLVEETATFRELDDRMLGLYPNRVNRGALWGSRRAIEGWNASLNCKKHIIHREDAVDQPVLLITPRR
jgi:hypothetical protein